MFLLSEDCVNAADYANSDGVDARTACCATCDAENDFETFAHVDGRYYDMSEAKYSRTFVATGCCNQHVYSSWWPTQTASTVFADMLVYCEHARDWTGDAWRRDFCGCGSVPPTTCVLQSAFTDGPAYPLDKKAVSGLWDSAPHTDVSEQNFRVNQIVACDSP